MTVLENFLRASHLVKIGDLDGATAQYERLLAEIMGLSPANMSVLSDDFIMAAGDLTDLLRWNRRYDDAIALQHQLAQLLPDEAKSFRIAAATLMIEAGVTKPGLAQLIVESRTLGFADGRLLLAAYYIWLSDYQAATSCLRDICDANGTLPQQRAAAHLELFRVFGKQNKIPEALDAWKTAVALDAAIGSTIPELIRILIYWYQYDLAIEMIRQDPVEVRRSFFTTLIARKMGTIPTRSDWNWVQDLDPSTLTLGQEEYAEAALRNTAPSLAIAALMPAIQGGPLRFRPLFLSGLAYAQQRELNRAKWALDRALRLADAEWPRRTRTGQGREPILDAESRITYGEIPIDADIRAYLDRYFMPVNSID